MQLCSPFVLPPLSAATEQQLPQDQTHSFEAASNLFPPGN